MRSLHYIWKEISDVPADGGRVGAVGPRLPVIKAVGIVSVLMEAETARPTVALNAANPGHYGEEKHS